MAHQYMPKIFHGPHKNPPAPLPTYLVYDRLNGQESDGGKRKTENTTFRIKITLLGYI